MKLRTIAFFAAIIFAAASGTYQLVEAPETSAQGASSAFILTTQGTLSASGTYTHSSGTFFKVVEGTPLPTPSPTATPPCEPSPGAPGGKLYVGQYMLSDSSSGNFALLVPTGSQNASGSGAPDSLPNNPTIVEQGPLGLTMQLDENDFGFGTLSFTSSGTAYTGTLTMFTSIDYPPTDPVVCGTPTPTPTPSGNPTPTPTPTPPPSPTPTPTPGGTVDIAGRVLTPTGIAIRNAPVVLTDPVGFRRTATTSSFGSFRFDAIPRGQQYILTSQSKRYRFSPLIFTPTQSMNNVDLVGME